ncbi:MAG: amidohydrolase family protein [Candidatus Omnitrophica bacterium]|nr:amidohydrolase family protein [Candidatus Omnitrophota bacterium]
MIIDAEVHIIPPEISNMKKSAFVREKAFKQAIYEHPEGEMALKLSTIEELLKSMELCKIDKCLLMGLPWRDHHLTLMNNSYVKNVIDANKGKFYGLGLVTFSKKLDIKSQLKELKEIYGFLGVKVIPSWQRFKLDGDEFAPVVEELIKQKMILFPHIDYVTASSSEQGPHNLFNLIKKYPELKILAPHLGGLLCLHFEFGPIKKYFSNTRFVTSVGETMQMVENASKVLDENMLIFGTDYPFQPNHDQKTILERFEKLNIDPKLKEKILSNNFREFINV